VDFIFFRTQASGKQQEAIPDTPAQTGGTMTLNNPDSVIRFYMHLYDPH